MNKGWICPKCDSIWAPFVPNCLICCFQRISTDKYSGDIDPSLLGSLQQIIPEEQNSTKVKSFLQGPRKGMYFTKFSKEALNKWVQNQEPSEPKNTELGQDIQNVIRFLATPLEVKKEIKTRREITCV